MEDYLTDIAGVRVICSFPEDVYTLAGALLQQDDVRLITMKDYIAKPKENGYRSLHMIVEIPIFLAQQKRMMKVEIQIRTIAMDFWASLEHKIYYKFEGNAPAHISQELKECADMISDLDDKMLSLNIQILACLEEQTESY
jgi:putative GTP pyrophosphokinase